MAKKGGIFSAFRNLFRFAIWTLAGILVAAIWFNWQADDVAVVAPEVTLPDVTTEDVATEAEPETAAEPETVAEEVVEAVEDAADDVEEAVSETAAAAEETVTDAVDAVEEAVEGVTEDVADAVENAASDLTSTDTSVATPLDTTTITIPGTDTSFTLINAFRRDNGAIEVTTEQVTGGSGATLWLVTCAPLAVGEIASGDSAGTLGARIEDPEMTEIPLSDPRAMIAGTACGVMR